MPLSAYGPTHEKFRWRGSGIPQKDRIVIMLFRKLLQRRSGYNCIRSCVLFFILWLAVYADTSDCGLVHKFQFALFDCRY
jgi:hypothetical protein